MIEGLMARWRVTTCSLSSILKRRMQLKRMEIQIEKNVAWNFGYDPSYVWHHELLDRRNDLSLIVSKTDSEWWAIYERFRDADNCKRLAVFLPTNVKVHTPLPASATDETEVKP